MKLPDIIIDEFRYKLTDYRVEKYNLLTGEFIESGLEFKHDNFEFADLLHMLWKSNTTVSTLEEP